MNTTAGSFNTKSYFVARSFLQIIYLYLSLTLVCDRSLIWGKLELTENKSEVESLQVICMVVAFFSTVIFIVLLVTANSLLKIKTRTEFDAVRNEDG